MKLKNNTTMYKYNKQKHKIKNIKEIIDKMINTQKIISIIAQQYYINIEGIIRTV